MFDDEATARTAHRQPGTRPAPVPPLNDAAIGLAIIIVLVATPAAIYFLANIQLVPAAAALAIALTAAFGPRIYADFIQPRSPSAVVQAP
jgi:hypothetical protein